MTAVVALAWWQGVLEVLGRLLAFFYDLIPNYGVAIILLTLLVRVVLLPLAIKQVRSMREMQALQPKLQALQQKYKGNRQKFAEEQMKLYREHGVNPLGGCLPLVMQIPVFIALYSVLIGDPNKAVMREGEGANRAVAHLPADSALAEAINSQNAGFLGMNLSCSPTQAGRGVAELPGGGDLDCGSDFLAAIPFYVLVALMVGSTWYQQKQMQTTAVGPQAAQLKMMSRIMPLVLGFVSLQIPAGVLVYWVTTNMWQIGQQQVMLPRKPKAQVESRPPPKSSGSRSSGSRSKGSRNAGSRKKRPKR
ncbi:MAG: YidC/Oxa1 family membrane protein insertase [Actinomycetota bacterium]